MRDVIDSYIGQFEIIHNGEPWLDETFKGKLKGITEQEVFAQPHDLLSVAEELWHLIAWRDVVLRRMQGEVIPFNEVPNWKPLEFLEDLGWTKLNKRFNDSHDDLIHWLKKQDDSILKDTYEDTSYTFQYYLEGLIHHDAYHLGQIGLVLKLIRKSNYV